MANKSKKFINELTELLAYSNPHQHKIIKELIKHKGNFSETARTLDYCDHTAVLGIVSRVRKKAAKSRPAQIALHKEETPAGFSIDRISKHIDKEGNVSGWVIANREQEDKFQAMKEAWEGVAASLTKATLTPVPATCRSKLLCDYTIGDAHIGLYAWAKEAGDDWDLANGVGILKKGMNHLVETAPPAETAFILDVGDFFHTDSADNETRASKNKLDVDTRWARVLEAGIESICYLIDLALQKHKKVIYRSVIGNHNEHSAVFINIAVKLRYSNEPRLEVLDSPALHNYYQFGVNLLADTHGHTTKADNLPLLMATDVPQMWAETTNRIWRTGHVHHLSQKEYSGCTVVTYRTLTPKDSWHAGQGYRSNRDMRCTTYHKDNGTVGINIVNPTMLGY
jgi:hypothetical protein